MNATKPLPKRIVRRGLNAIDRQPIARKLVRRLALSGAVHRAMWSRLSADSEFTVSLEGRELNYTFVPGDQIANTLFWRGEYEVETSHVFAALARRAKVVIDVGANTGFYSLLACLMNETARVVAFEPAPRIAEILERNISLNDWGDRCEIRREAVAERCGVTQFHVPHSNVPTSASMHRDGFRGYAGDLIDVPVVTVDSICERFERVDLFKIDVEGFEHKVLEGMTETLGRCHPNIFIECNIDGPCEEMEALLQQFGYRFYSLRDKGATKRDHLIPDPSERFLNYLCSADPAMEERLTT